MKKQMITKANSMGESHLGSSRTLVPRIKTVYPYTLLHFFLEKLETTRVCCTMAGLNVHYLLLILLDN